MKAIIKITQHWNIPHDENYSIGDEYPATLHPCIDIPSGVYFAELDNNYIIPNGCFDIVKQDGIEVEVEESEVKRIAINIVNQILDKSGVSVKKRQEINDKCDEFVCHTLNTFLAEFKKQKGL